MKKISLKNVNGKERFKVDFSWKNKNVGDVFYGNPLSNVCLGIIYTWLYNDKNASEFFMKCIEKIGGYCSIGGMIRTVYGLNFAISSILENPNINKFLILVPEKTDNTHFVAETIIDIYCNKKIKNSKVKELNIGKKYLQRFRKQVDLIVIRKVQELEDIKKLLDILVSDKPAKIEDVKKMFKYIEIYSNEHYIYDDGARFEEGVKINLTIPNPEIFVENETNLIEEIQKRMVKIGEKNIVWNLIIHLLNKKQEKQEDYTKSNIFDLEFEEFDQKFYVIKKCKLSEIEKIIEEGKKCKESYITYVFLSIED
ncbi:MAG: hypothetical protein QW524_03085 [Candidatus Woesearchaeota archaeon]